jgi:very-short-patch-repair endonuclease
MSHLEDTLCAQLALAGFKAFKREFCAIPGRRFRWDFAWPDNKLLVEVQGGTWNGGSHGRGSGISRDTEKLNLATCHGWRVLQFTPDQVREGKALRWVQQFFKEVA